MRAWCNVTTLVWGEFSVILLLHRAFFSTIAPLNLVLQKSYESSCFFKTYVEQTQTSLQKILDNQTSYFIKEKFLKLKQYAPDQTASLPGSANLFLS